MEEFIEGHEGFYDTITVDGQVAVDFAPHYYPNVLEAMRTRWISPEFISTNRIDTAPEYGELREMGAGHQRARDRDVGHAHGVVLRAQGPEVLRDRLPAAGVGAWDLYSAGNDMDVYREWATPSSTAGPATRRRGGSPAGSWRCAPTATASSAGTAASRSSSSSSASGSSTRTCRPPGTPTQGVEAGYMANAYVRMRHPDYDALRGMLDEVGRTLHVHAS